MNVGEWLAIKANEVAAYLSRQEREKHYTRPDGAVMVPIAPDQYVNKDAAILLGLWRE